MYHVGDGFSYGAAETISCGGYDTVNGTGNAHQLALDELCTAFCKLKIDMINRKSRHFGDAGFLRFLCRGRGAVFVYHLVVIGFCVKTKEDKWREKNEKSIFYWEFLCDFTL